MPIMGLTAPDESALAETMVHSAPNKPRESGVAIEHCSQQGLPSFGAAKLSVAALVADELRGSK